MGKADEYVQAIRKHNRRDIVRLFYQLAEGETPSGWAKGKAFEHLIVRAFELEGASVTWPFSVRHEESELEQIDGAVQDDGLFCLLETKHWRNEISFDAIAKLRTQLARRPAQSMGAIFSMRGFTNPARILAQFATPISVLLWDKDDIEYGLTRRRMRWGLQQKFRHAIEHGLPRYNIFLEKAP